MKAYNNSNNDTVVDTLLPAFLAVSPLTALMLHAKITLA
jgi:hypothetical protein